MESNGHFEPLFIRRCLLLRRVCSDHSLKSSEILLCCFTPKQRRVTIGGRASNGKRQSVSHQSGQSLTDHRDVAVHDDEWSFEKLHRQPVSPFNLSRNPSADIFAIRKWIIKSHPCCRYRITSAALIALHSLYQKRPFYTKYNQNFQWNISRRNKWSSDIEIFSKSGTK